MKRTPHSILLTAVSALALLTPAFLVPAAAEDSSASASASPSSTSKVSEITGIPTMLVLDASSSMNEKDLGSDKTRMEIAKQAVTDITSNLNEAVPLGLTVYGSEIPDSAGAEKACNDIDVKLAPEQRSGKKIADAIKDVEAKGFTPIGNALKAAAEKLPDGEESSIVLVSDGIDTCAPPPPCDVVKDLKEQGVDVTINTVGVKPDEETAETLKCIAQVTDGVYTAANNADELSSKLNYQLRRGLNIYEPEGQKIKGATQLDSDKPLIEPGQYLDSLDKGSNNTASNSVPGDVRYYDISPAQDQLGIVSVTTILPQTAIAEGEVDIHDFINIYVETIEDSTGETCASENKAPHGWDAFYQPITISVTVPGKGSKEFKNCDEDKNGKLALKVSRRGELLAHEPAPIEINVAGIPDNSDETSDAETAQAEVEDKKEEPIAEGTNKTEVVPGNSFGTATEIEEGDYVSYIVPGEYQVFKIKADYGQKVRTRLSLEGENAYEEIPASHSLSLATYSYNPLRESQKLFDGSTISEWETKKNLPYNKNENIFVQADYPSKINFANRLEGTRDFRTISIGGYQYILVGLGGSVNEDTNLLQGYHLTVDVEGEPTEGPTPVTSVNDDSWKPQSIAYSTESKSASSSSSSSAESSSPAVSDDSSSNEASGTAKHSLFSGVMKWIVVLLVAGLVVLLGIVGLIIFLANRSRKQ